jgi:hypothetical protein
VTDDKFKKQKADEEDKETISMLATAVSRLLRDDGADADLCRHVLLKLSINHYKYNTETGASREEVSRIMWDEYASIVRQEFQEFAPEMLGGMLSAAKADADAFTNRLDDSLLT